MQHTSIIRPLGLLGALLGLLIVGGPARAQWDHWDHWNHGQHSHFGGWHQIDELANQLRNSARDLHQEIHSHLEHYPIFSHLDSDVSKIERWAEHIHEVAHQAANHHHGDVDHIRDDVDQLDQLVHHVQSLLEQQAQQGVASSDWHGLTHCRRVAQQLLYTLHRLQSEVRYLNHDFHYHHDF